MSKTVTVGISDLNAVRDPDIVVTYALGSCCGICLYDAAVKVAGLSHIMLPSSKLVNAKGQEMKFADTAIEILVRKMEQMGASRIRMKAKIAGGAQMFAAMGNTDLGNIGNRNVAAVKQELARLRIPIIAEDTGKNYGRTVFFYAENGQMKIKSVNRGESVF